MENNLIEIDYDNIDVEDIMRQIRENIRKRNYSTEELDNLKKDLNASYSEGDFDLVMLNRNVALNNVRWNIQKANQIRSNRKLIGPFIVLGKRILRKLSYWYIQFLVDQQNEFNSSVTISINEIEKYIKRSTKAITEMPELFNEKIEYLEDSKNKLSEKIEHLEANNKELNEQVESLNEKIKDLDKITLAVNKIAKIEESVSANIEDIENIGNIIEKLRYFEKENKKLTHSPDFIDMNYFLFESIYRGSREEIKSKQKFYLDYFKDRKGVLDIGCGRGEFIELLIESNTDVFGIDLDMNNVNYCIDKGLPVKHAEALEYLGDCEDSSLGGIFMAQVAEHLQPNDLVTLIRLAWKKLQTGAYFIAETINPQSLIVFTESYYMDPSHRKMVHPLTIKFLLETEGFTDIDIRYLSPVSDEHKIPKLECIESCKNIDSFNNAIARLNDLVYGYREYAVIAKRQDK